MVKSWRPMWEACLAGQPQTHVLIIGVGKYRHLPGGGGTVVKPGLTFGLGQLTSPPISARAFADWVLQQNGYRNDEAPLGSVDLLLSEYRAKPYLLPDERVVNVKQANIDNIRKAFNAWLDRCESHPGNVAIFYFCGHGVWIRGDHVLLVEDYGRERRNPFSGSMNFSKMTKELMNRRARLQCYFIDACSNVPIPGKDEEGSRIEDSGAQTFLMTTEPKPRQEPFLVLRAAAPGHRAYAEDNDVSRFTKVLLECLQGRGCEPGTINGQWVVTTASLASNIHRVLNYLNENPNEPIQTAADEQRSYGRIHVRNDPPAIPVIVRLVPSEAIGNARLSLDAHMNPNWHPDRQPATDCWEIEKVPVGFYTLHAYFDPPRYQDVELGFVVMPPGPVPDSIRLQEV